MNFFCSKKRAGELKQACFIFVCSFYLLLTFAWAENTTKQKPYKIGFIGPLTGAAASYGLSSKNGIEMAVRELGAGSQVKVLYEDDQFQASKTVSAFKKFSEIEKVDAIISIASTPSHAIAPLASERGILLFAWASDPRVSLKRKNIIRTYPSGQAEGKRAAVEAERLNYKNIGIFYSQSDYSSSVQQGFVDQIPKKLIRSQEEFSAEAGEFKADILRAKSRGVEQVYVCLQPGQAGLFAKQLRQLKINWPIFGCESLNTWSEVELSDKGLLNSWLVSVLPSEEFRLSYRKEFGNDDIISGAAIHYDLIKLLNAVVSRENQKWSGAEISQALSQLGLSHGAIPNFQYQLEGQDPHLEIELSIRRIGVSGFE